MTEYDELVIEYTKLRYPHITDEKDFEGFRLNTWHYYDLSEDSIPNLKLAIEELKQNIKQYNFEFFYDETSD
jgi:hypothetical protein